MLLVTSSVHFGIPNSCTFPWSFNLAKESECSSTMQALPHAMIYDAAAVCHEFSKERADCDCAVGYSLFRSAMEQRRNDA